MDYPISVPSVGLVAGKFVDENPLLGTPGSLIPAQWGNAVTDEILNVISTAGLAPNEALNTQLATAIAMIIDSGKPLAAPVVGSVRNLRCSVAAASASATITANDVVVKLAQGGVSYLLSTFNKTVNLGSIGAGGMDTGLAPVSGFVGLYAIYNPATTARALLAVNATSALLPDVYGGANMPAGYTASALISVWPTNASGQFAIGTQIDREIATQTNSVLTTSVAQATLIALSIGGAVPRNAVSCRGEYMATASIAGSGVSGVISGSANEIGRIPLGFTAPTAFSGVTIAFPFIQVLNAQTIYYRVAISSGALNFMLSINGYSI